MPKTATLVESSKHSNDTELRQRFDEDGYLFFRNVLDRNMVTQTRLDILDVLRKFRLIPQNELSEPMWSGKNLGDPIEIQTAIYALKSYEELRKCNEVMEIMEQLWGTSIYCWKDAPVRTQPPKAATSTPAHQDYQLFFRGGRFSVGWIPLMDIDENVGGVELAPGSHKILSEKDYVLLKGRYVTSRAYSQEAAEKAIWLPQIPQEKIGGFVRTNYEVGDLLVMHDSVAHRSVPNSSKKIRLSMDTRFQPQDSSIPWYAKVTDCEQERYLRRSEDAMVQAGATQEQMQRIFWRIYFFEGTEITPERVINEIQRFNPPLFGAF